MGADADGRTGGRVGVRDVAVAAGVSTQTVSRVINEHPGIRAETRARVLDAMAALGYRVNNAARALGTRRSRTLGVLVSDATLYGPAVGAAALEAAARRAGRWVATTYADAADDASVDVAVEHLLAQGVDGVILVAPREETAQRLAARSLGVPVAELNSGAGAQRQAEGAALAVGHLIGLGHRRIARLGGPGDWLEETARRRGAERELDAHRLAVVHGWSGDWSAASGAAVADEIAAAVRHHDGPTAVIVANDQMALGLVAALSAAGVSVPDEVSVVGFDDNPDAAFYRPALTTVRVDAAGEAARCVAEIIGVPAEIAPAPARLIVRGSTASPC